MRQPTGIVIELLFVKLTVYDLVAPARLPELLQMENKIAPGFSERNLHTINCIKADGVQNTTERRIRIDTLH